MLVKRHGHGGRGDASAGGFSGKGTVRDSGSDEYRAVTVDSRSDTVQHKAACHSGH